MADQLVIPNLVPTAASSGDPTAAFNTSATAQLVDAFHKGFISADDIVTRLNEAPAKKAKAQAETVQAKEFMSPAAAAARQNTQLATSANAQLSAATAQAQSGLLPQSTNIAQEEGRKKLSSLKFGTGADTYTQYSSLFSTDSGDHLPAVVTGADGKTDYDAMGATGKQMEGKLSLRQIAQQRLVAEGQPIKVQTKQGEFTLIKNAQGEDITPGSEAWKTYRSMLSQPLTVSGFGQPGQVQTQQTQSQGQPQVQPKDEPVNYQKEILTDGVQPSAAAVTPSAPASVTPNVVQPQTATPAQPQTQAAVAPQPQQVNVTPEDEATGSATTDLRQGLDALREKAKGQLVTPKETPQQPSSQYPSYVPGQGVKTGKGTEEYTSAQIMDDLHKMKSYEAFDNQAGFAQAFKTATKKIEKLSPQQQRSGSAKMNALDIALAESIIKLYDPGMAIREFKWDKLTEAQPYLEKLKNWKAEFLHTGSGGLTPEGRDRLIEMGYDNVNGKEAAVRPHIEMASHRAVKSGLDPADVLNSNELRILQGEPFGEPRSSNAAGGTASATGKVQQADAIVNISPTIYRVGNQYFRRTAK